MNEEQAKDFISLMSQINGELRDIRIELQRHNDSAKDRTDGIEEAIREVSKAVMDGCKEVASNIPEG